MIDREIGNLFDRRSALLLGCGAVLTSALVLRMLQMQLFNYKTYKSKSENNALRIQVRLPERAKILSNKNAPLARDMPIYRIYIIPEEAEDLEALIETVVKELKIKPAEEIKLRKKISSLRRFQPALVRETLDWDTLAGLISLNLSGLHAEPGFARRYPLGDAASHVAGFVGIPKTLPNTKASKAMFYTTGMTGLEKAFDEQLAGTPGQDAIIINAVGRQIGQDEALKIQAEPGTPLKTTVNDSVQKILYDQLIQYTSGCGVAMEIATGNILAMASAPGFDAEMLRTDDGPEYMKQLLANPHKPFMNKTIECLYPPGSTFKIVVALAALESGAVSPSEKIFCPGYWEYGKHVYHCWEKQGHGWENMSDAIAHSCDIYFYQIALRIGIDAIKSMAEKLGLGQKLLNLFPQEMAGIIPDREWKAKNVRQKWQHGDTIISGIGQGFVLANCLQLCTMMSRVASNRIILPSLTPVGTNNYLPLQLQQKNIDIVLGGLERVMQPGGTAAASAINVNGARMGGKTGTSQVRNISMRERETGVLTNEQLSWKQRNHGLFVGFAPTSAPKYAIAVITEHAGGSGAAARTAAATMKEMLKPM